MAKSFTMFAGVFSLVGLSASCIQAQESESLGQAANDPTASLLALQFADWYTSDFHNLPGDANQVVFRPVIPFSTGNFNHIMRATVPFITDSPVLSDGLSDTILFDLVVFDASWGRWGVGPVALFPTGGSTRGADKWAAGPAAGFTVAKGKLLWGFFNQNLFTYASEGSGPDVNISILQPIFNYSLGNGWSVGVSEMTVTYDWEAQRWASLPLGAQLNKLVRIGGQAVQLSGQYEHDFADDALADPSDTFRFTTKFLFPTGG